MRNFLFVIYLTFGIGIGVSLFFPMLKASTLFAPDSDTALLVNLVTTTASQLNELEKLVSSTEKYTGLMEKYNQIAKDEYFRAERITWIAQNYVELSKRDPKDLEKLNSAIRGLKSETESLKTVIGEYQKDEAINEIDQESLSAKVSQSNKELNFANSQVMRSGSVRSTNEAQQLIAQNSALSYKTQVEANQTNSVIAEKLAEQNKLLNREMKDKAKRQEEKEEFYLLRKNQSKRADQ